MNLELLRTFLAAEEASNLAAAARQRHVTKSAISQQLKVLEAQMAVPLFERVGRTLRPTDEARALASALRPAFARIDDALEAATSRSGEVKGPVRLGAPRPFTRAWLRPRLAALLEAHPALVLTVRFGVPSELARALVVGELDIAVLSADVPSPLLDRETIFVESFVAVASPAYLSAHGTPRTPEALLAHRFLAFDRDLPMHGPWWRAAFGRTKAEARVVAWVESLDELLGLAAAGSGIAVLPDYFVADALARGEVVVVAPKGKRPLAAKNAIVAAWRRGARPSARVEAVRAALVAKGRR